MHITKAISTIKAAKAAEKAEPDPAVEAGFRLVTAHVAEQAALGVRVTYSRLAELAIDAGWIQPSPLSLGQRGSQLVGKIPAHLHWAICRSNGRYHTSAPEKWGDITEALIASKTIKKGNQIKGIDPLDLITRLPREVIGGQIIE